MCECGTREFYVTDAAAGDVVCQQCGVVVEAHIFDEHLEYYTEHSGPRAGPPESWLLPPQPIVVDKIPHRKRIMQNADPHAPIRELFCVVDHMGHRFSTPVQDTAKMLCRDLATRRTVRADVRPVCAACALYLATKMHGNGVGRSKKEVAAQFGEYGVTERGLTVTARLFKDLLGGAAYSKQLLNGLDAADLINRCVDRLDISEGMRKVVKRDAHALADRIPTQEVEGKTPSSICSGVVACVLQRLEIKVSKKHLTESCRVSGATLEKMAKLVQQWSSPAPAAPAQKSPAAPAQKSPAAPA